MQALTVAFEGTQARPEVTFRPQFRGILALDPIPDSVFVYQPVEGAAPIPFKPRRSASQPPALETKGGQPWS